MELVIGTRAWSTWSLRPWLVLKRTGAPFTETLIALRQDEARIRGTYAGYFERIDTLESAAVPLAGRGGITIPLFVGRGLKRWPPGVTAPVVSKAKSHAAKVSAVPAILELSPVKTSAKTTKSDAAKRKALAKNPNVNQTDLFE
jgi:hypothetical protein